MGFLSSGVWNHCREGSHGKELVKNCGLSYAHLHGSFNSYFEYSNKEINNVNGSKEFCYCVRIPSTSKGVSYETRVEETYMNSREVRYFEIDTPFGIVRASYFSNFLDFVWANTSYPPFTDRVVNSTLCQPGQCGQEVYDSALRYTTKTALQSVIPRLKIKPTHLFVSSWQGANIGCALKTYQKRHCPECKVHYLSSVAGRDYNLNEIPKQDCNIGIFNRVKLTEALPEYLYFPDGVHVTSSVNQEFNQIMLDMVC